MSDLTPIPYTYPECGHTRRLIKKNRDKKPALCWDCQRKRGPIIEWAAKASENGGVLRLSGRGHWAAGWLFHLTGHPMRSVDPAPTAEILAGWLSDWQAHPLTQLQREHGTWTTAYVTRAITGVLLDCARASHALAYRELQLPVNPGGATRCGRLDVVIWQPHFPDIVAANGSATASPSGSTSASFSAPTVTRLAAETRTARQSATPT